MAQLLLQHQQLLLQNQLIVFGDDIRFRKIPPHHLVLAPSSLLRSSPEPPPNPLDPSPCIWFVQSPIPHPWLHVIKDRTGHLSCLLALQMLMSEPHLTLVSCLVRRLVKPPNQALATHGKHTPDPNRDAILIQVEHTPR
eukprot:CAMPEP_0206258030 /NCGR_PEP_ID=MMETSP0047_2-20121206/25687_1 /ASSEMBLY_ACC=CAM_ASM_000192 /TAXON_ID=195065 /ORGANISM="Chroomonas mesostigmatica_cf, Strain CCMP1168" /LENGTH=138 /DNA_ID=CAMNT_0053684717 /DNA_START=242 /DNA_END=658 /DNA_ORIENTATION=+